MTAVCSSPKRLSVNAATQPMNWCSEIDGRRVIFTEASGRDVLAEDALDLARVQALAAVQAIEEAVDDFLGFVLVEILDEPVVKVFARERVVDLGFLVVVLQFGEIDDPV